MEKITDTIFYWDLTIELESRKTEIESCLPKVSDQVFEEYCMIWEVLGALWKTVPSL